MTKTLKDFYNALGARESGGNYKAVNSYGFIGKYQMGEAALTDAGYYTPKTHVHYNKNIWDGQFTGKDGVYSVEDFLNNPQAQENAQRIYKQKQWGYIKNVAQKYDGKTINGIPITQSGMLAAAHLLGQRNLINYLQSNGKNVKRDGYNTSIEEYLKKFAGYDVSEITGIKNNSSIQPKQPLQTTTNPATTSSPPKNVYLPSSDEIPFANPVNSTHIFTPEEIGNMTREEFERNLPIIEQQLKDGLIKPQTVRPKDYSTFKNPETGTDKIYTREDISKMSTDEYSKNEKEIMAQMNSIGIPFKNDLPANIKTHEKEKSYPTSSENADGKWVTINGNHVLIKD